MKCAKEVMEHWKESTDTMYARNLTKMVDMVTEHMFKQASDGNRTVIPEVWIWIDTIQGGREGARMVYMSGQKDAIPLMWNEFEVVMKSLCYTFKLSRSGAAYIITPNPSC